MMLPFQGFRRWSRITPNSHKAAVGVAALLVVGAVAATLAPGSNPPGQVAIGGALGSSGSAAATRAAAPGASQTGSTVPGASGGPGGAAATGGGAGSQAAGGAAVAGAGTAGTGQGSTAGGSTSATGGGPGGAAPGRTGPVGTIPGVTPTPAACPASSAPGVSSSTVKVAIILTNIIGPAGNQTFGVAPVSQQQDAYQASVDQINQAGGVACRKISPQYYTVNPVDSSDLQQKCLEISAAGVFAVLDTGAVAAIAGGADCYGQHHIPFFTAVGFTAKLQSEYYPYQFGFGTLDHLYHDTVFALKDRGTFNPPSFKKLGILYRDCFPELFTEEESWLHQAGVGSSQIDAFDVGCPTALSPPSTLEQAVLNFQSSGVTHVTIVNEQGDFATFTKIAQQQNFHPQYVLPDDQDLIADSYGSSAPDPNNLANAIGITNNGDGENTTPGFTPSAATEHCNAAIKEKGMAPVYQDAAAVGNACDQVWMLAAAVDHSPALQQQDLAAGLQRTGQIAFSFPQAPANYAVSLNGEDSWRAAQWNSSCPCWRLLSPNFNPSYPGAPDPAYR